MKSVVTKVCFLEVIIVNMEFRRKRDTFLTSVTLEYSSSNVLGGLG